MPGRKTYFSSKEAEEAKKEEVRLKRAEEVKKKAKEYEERRKAREKEKKELGVDVVVEADRFKSPHVRGERGRFFPKTTLSKGQSEKYESMKKKGAMVVSPPSIEEVIRTIEEITPIIDTAEENPVIEDKADEIEDKIADIVHADTLSTDAILKSINEGLGVPPLVSAVLSSPNAPATFYNAPMLRSRKRERLFDEEKAIVPAQAPVQAQAPRQLARRNRVFNRNAAAVVALSDMIRYLTNLNAETYLPLVGVIAGFSIDQFLSPATHIINELPPGIAQPTGETFASGSNFIRALINLVRISYNVVINRIASTDVNGGQLLLGGGSGNGNGGQLLLGDGSGNVGPDTHNILIEEVEDEETQGAVPNQDLIPFSDKITYVTEKIIESSQSKDNIKHLVDLLAPYMLVLMRTLVDLLREYLEKVPNPASTRTVHISPQIGTRVQSGLLSSSEVKETYITRRSGVQRAQGRFGGAVPPYVGPLNPDNMNVASNKPNVLRQPTSYKSLLQRNLT